MPVEQEKNEAESIPPGYRTLTEEELNSLKLALSKKELTQAERDKLMHAITESRDKVRTTVETFEIEAVCKRELLTLKAMREESRRTKEQLLKAQQSLWEIRQWDRDAAGMKKKWFFLGMMAVLIPIFLYQFYWMIRCSPHW